MRKVFFNVADFDIWWGVCVSESERGMGGNIIYMSKT